MKKAKSKEYLEFVANFPCLFCGKTPAGQAHHVRWAGICGIGIKPSDLLVVPACLLCHDALHNMIGKRYREIVSKIGREDILACMVDLLVEWLEKSDVGKGEKLWLK